MTPALMFLASMALMWLAFDIQTTDIAQSAFFAMILWFLALVFAIDSLIDAGSTAYLALKDGRGLRERIDEWLD